MQLATFKHLSSKKADYGAAEKYLLFEHDEFTNKPVLDESGRLIPRENCRFATLNCGDDDFAIACMKSNLQYGKNRSRGDVKSHHYIISFDPRDGIENGLTVDRAQTLGEQFCKEHFAGHQAIVCTHADGHNHSGNIHCHIVINSLRIADMPLLPYMDRPADTRAGCKHRCTEAAMNFFRAEVMEMCQREGLYQIDLLNGSKERVTEGEYRTKRRGQAELSESGKLTKFETDKEKLRQIIKKALEAATDFEDFAKLLSREGVTVKQSRGRLSYLTSDRSKPITARRLGDDVDLAAINAVFEQKSRQLEQKAVPDRSSRPSILSRLQCKLVLPPIGLRNRERLITRPLGQNPACIAAKKAKIDTYHDSISRMVDVTPEKGAGFEHWAKVFNLKQSAKSLAELESYGFKSLEDLKNALAAAKADESECREKLKGVESELRDKKEHQKRVLAYANMKPIRNEYRSLKSDRARGKFRKQHESEFIMMESAQKYFKEHGITKIPSYKTLQSEIERLTSQQNELYAELKEKRGKVKRLQTVADNIERTLHEESNKSKDKNQEI